MSHFVRSARLALVVSVLVWSISRVCAEVPLPSREYQIKAAFLFNFVKFVEWQDAAPGDSIRFCVLGHDPFGAALDSLAGKTLKGRSVAIQRFASRNGLEACRVLFVSRSENERLSEILAPLSNSGVLTVGETEEFSRAGGIITFRIEENKTRFVINASVAERGGLKISSKLLHLATEVR